MTEQENELYEAINMYVYILSENHQGNHLCTVGFYDPQGKWNPESDYQNTKDAAKRVHFLNGGDNRIPRR
jgi:hypothetical protein